MRTQKDRLADAMYSAQIELKESQTEESRIRLSKVIAGLWIAQRTLRRYHSARKAIRRRFNTPQLKPDGVNCVDDIEALVRDGCGHCIGCEVLRLERYDDYTSIQCLHPRTIKKYRGHVLKHNCSSECPDGRIKQEEIRRNV